MENIFEICIHIMMAYFQVVMLCVGIVFCLFGGAAFISFIQQKNVKRRWLNATICAVREGESLSADGNGAMSKTYYPVFETIGVDGNPQRYEHQSGSGNINKYKIGMRCKISPLENQAGFAVMDSDAPAEIIIGLFLCAIGGMLIFLPVKFIPFSNVTFAVWGITILFVVLKFSKYIKPKNMRETVAQFRQRKSVEALNKQQSKPIVSQEYVRDMNKQVEHIGGIASKVAILVGFAILVVGGMGYNTQLEFIDNAQFEKVGPCGLELGEDCRRPILYQDIVSIVPLELRPVMDGIYKSKSDPNKIIVSYGSWTPLPYFLLMGLGGLIIFSNSRRIKKL